jgi:hypothetical protein
MPLPPPNPTLFGMQMDPAHMAAILGVAGILSLAIARHMPCPLRSQRCSRWPLYAWVYDTIQDLAKNNDRIGKDREDPVSVTEVEDHQLKLPLTHPISQTSQPASE